MYPEHEKTYQPDPIHVNDTHNVPLNNENDVQKVPRITRTTYKTSPESQEDEQSTSHIKSFFCARI